MPLSFSVVMAVMTVFDDALSFFQSFHAPKERDPDHGFCTCPVDFSNEAGAACSTHISRFARDQTKCVCVCACAWGATERTQDNTRDWWPGRFNCPAASRRLAILPDARLRPAATADPTAVCAAKCRADWRAGLCVFAIRLQPHPLQPYRTSSKLSQ